MSSGPRDRAEALYPLAFLGAYLGFIPLFALLLPRRVAAIFPGEAVERLSLLLLVGGVVASLAHIAAGRWSDGWMRRRGTRRGLIALGLAALLVSYGTWALAAHWTGLLVAMVAFQAALNLMFAPLGALLADHVADARKGRMAGWLNAMLPLSSAGTALVAFALPDDGPGGFLLVAALVLAAVAPLLLHFPFAPARAAVPPVATRERAGQVSRSDFARLWTARLLVQLGAAFVINYFYLYLALRLPPGEATERMGALALLATIVSLVAAILAGHWTDRTARRRPPMVAAAGASALGLAILAADPSTLLASAGFIAFHLGLAAFLAVDSAMVAQLVASSPRRGTWLGVMNLTNTVPAIVVPALALASLGTASPAAWTAAFALAAGAALVAAVLVARVRAVA